MVKHYDKHVDTGCSKYLHIIVKGLLTKPLSEPLNKVEERMTSKLVRRKMSTSSESTIKIQTGGPVSE